MIFDNLLSAEFAQRVVKVKFSVLKRLLNYFYNFRSLLCKTSVLNTKVARHEKVH